MTRKAVLAAAIAGLLAGCGTMGGGMGGEHLALTAKEEVPVNTSTASGNGMVHVMADCSVKGHIKVTGMTATAAHIHEGKAGANGPVAVAFTKSGDNSFVAPDGAKMTESQCAAYKAGNMYVNVHSELHKGGEVRAQLKGR
jgi:hypothetical protein